MVTRQVQSSEAGLRSRQENKSVGQGEEQDQQGACPGTGVLAVHRRQGPELKCGSRAKGWRPWMRHLPVLFPAITPRIAKLLCTRLDLHCGQVEPVGGQGRVAKPIGMIQAVTLS